MSSLQAYMQQIGQQNQQEQLAKQDRNKGIINTLSGALGSALAPVTMGASLALPMATQMSTKNMGTPTPWSDIGTNVAASALGVAGGAMANKQSVSHTGQVPQYATKLSVLPQSGPAPSPMGLSLRPQAYNPFRGY